MEQRSARGSDQARFAICLSGSLRSFNTVRDNFVRAMVTPNAADVFVHIFYEPKRKDHRVALRWLLNAAFVRVLVSEVWDETLSRQVIHHFNSTAAMRNEAWYTRHLGKPISAMLSMWRKMWLCNELRKTHEQRRGFRYVGIVRARPDLAYGAPVHLEGLPFHDAVGVPVLYTPVPPESGHSWRFCQQEWLPAVLGAAPLALRLAHRPSQTNCTVGQYAVCRRQDADCPKQAQAACIESPLLDSLGMLVECPCCRKAVHTQAMHDIPVCGCRDIFATHVREGSRTRAFVHGELARFRSSLKDQVSWKPWSGDFVLDQLALASGPAMDTCAPALTAHGSPWDAVANRTRL